MALPPQFFRRSYLFLLTVLTGVYAVVAVTFPTPWVDLPLGLLTLVFVPGYALGALVFGAKPRWPWSLTFAIVVGLSVAFNVALGLILLAFQLGTPAPAFAFVALVLLMAASVVWVVTQPVETGSRFTNYVSEELRLPGHNPAQRAVAYALLIGVVLVLVLIVFIASIFPTPPGNLSLGITGPGGNSSNLLINGTTGTNKSGPVYTLYLVVGNNATDQKFVLYMYASINNTVSPNSTNPSWSNASWSNATRAIPLAGPTRANLTLNLNASESLTQKVHFFFSVRGEWVLTFLLSSLSGQVQRTAAWSMNIR
ncbi:MAG: DUF1616 domain-containing protein [Thermoplasmata archaeon]|nr:DUF1616 domain-containing protein [Thermoplasmata archaeon]